MKNILSKHRNLGKGILFLVLLATLLTVLSNLSIRLGRNVNPLLNYSSREIFHEPKNSIDILVIGTSDVYSGVSPLEWWNQYGYSGFAWGEPAQRVFDTHEYLKKIYRDQSPKVVFLEIGNLYRDQTDEQNLDSMAKAYIANVFPIVTYHRNLAPKKFLNLTAKPASITKGYLLRLGTMRPSEPPTGYMAPDGNCAPINSFSSKELEDCIELCRTHGSSVVLLSIPSFTDWNMEKHNSVLKLADQDQIPYLDLNLALKKEINWDTDSVDGGKHLNFKGAEKVSTYLGKYLKEHYTLPDHKEESSYHSWKVDYQDYAKEINRLLLQPT